MKTTFTLGEILRSGLLLNNKGVPYKHKASVLAVVLKLKYRRVNTAFGEGYAVPQSEIKKWNDHWKQLG